MLRTVQCLFVLMSALRPQEEEEVGGWSGGGLWALMWAVCLHIHQQFAIDSNKPPPGCISFLESPLCRTAKDRAVLFDCIAVGSLDVFTSAARQRWHPAVCHCLATDTFAARPSKVTLFLPLIELCRGELDSTVSFFFVSMQKSVFPSCVTTPWNSFFFFLKQMPALLFSITLSQATVVIQPVSTLLWVFTEKKITFSASNGKTISCIYCFF